MTPAEMRAHPEFRAFCRAWQQQRACPLPMTDWLLDQGLVGQAEGARWAAMGYRGTNWRIQPRQLRNMIGFAWMDSVPEPVRVEIPVLIPDVSDSIRGGKTFEEAVALLLDAWAVAGLSFEQMEATGKMLNGIGSKPVQTLGGFAGVGKSRVVSHLHSALPQFAVCAFTGKAVDVLKRKGVPQAQTIHGTIYRAVQENGRVRFVKRRRSEIYHDGFLIDEASQVSQEILDDLKEYELPIIAVGDHGQLPPVGSDAGLMREPDVTLETVHRNAGPIAKFAEHLRRGGDARDWRSGGGVWIGRDLPDPTLLNADQVICAYNSTRVNLNKKILEMRTGNRLFQNGHDGLPLVGDRIICTRNDRLIGVFNGMQGHVEQIDHRNAILWFRPEGSDEAVEVNYHPQGFHSPKGVKEERVLPGVNVPFDFAYCITVHKAQGAEFPKVVVFEQHCDLWEHSRWSYTAASRAREAVVWKLAG